MQYWFRFGCGFVRFNSMNWNVQVFAILARLYSTLLLVLYVMSIKSRGARWGWCRLLYPRSSELNFSDLLDTLLSYQAVIFSFCFVSVLCKQASIDFLLWIVWGFFLLNTRSWLGINPLHVPPSVIREASRKLKTSRLSLCVLMSRCGCAWVTRQTALFY